MTELGPLPKEWEIINLDEIIDLKRGISWRKEEANKEGNGIPVIGIPNIKENGIIDFIDTYFLTKDIPVDKMLRINDILFVGSSGSIKNIGRNVLIREIQKNKFTYASFTFLGRVDPLKANSEYIFYLLNSPMVDYNKYARRASDGKYNFQLTQFKNEQKLPLPPLPEQQRIAAVLSAVQEAKEKTQAVIDTTKALKKSMMKHLFTYGQVSPEETENVQIKETEIGKVPKDWEIVKLGEVAEISSGGTPSRKRNEYWIDGNISWIKSEQCHDCYISVANEYITDLGLENSSAKMLKKGTVLLAMVGATIGKTGFLTFEACTNQNIAGIFSTNGLNNLFLYYALQSRYNEFEKIKGYGIANLSYLRQFKIPLPPLPVQQKIASILSAI
ncbi:MAG TPA: restriction endonuclease subunit S, partial [Candidatus Dojkabacteria bacterium]|nr:restriction endonuclease subunit S [Candidatus Dojkabacteria bacterium]